MRVNASSINSRDLSTIENPSVRNLNYPFIPNSDGAGEVVAVGSAVTKFKVGDRVLSTLLQSWQDGDIQPVDHANALGGTLGGMLCEYRALPESGLVRTPEHLTDVEAATLTCAGVTAWHSQSLLYRSATCSVLESLLLRRTTISFDELKSWERGKRLIIKITQNGNSKCWR